MSWLELLATILGAICVLLLILRIVWAFPVGIVMSVLYAVIFYEAKFYADMLLQVIYVLMLTQGWYEWHRSAVASDDRIAVGRLNSNQWLATLALTALGAFSIGSIMQTWTDAALPWLDALTTSLSLLAQWWTNKRFLENWLIWIVADVLYLYQYYYKALYLTTGLYALYLFMAVWGYWEWKKRVVNT